MAKPTEKHGTFPLLRPRTLKMFSVILILMSCALAVIVIAQIRDVGETREAVEQSRAMERESVAEQSDVIEQRTIPNGWSTYTNPALKLSVALPSDADIITTVDNNTADQQKKLGRVGGIIVNSNTYGNPHWSVSVYTTKEKAEKDFGTGTSVFADYMKESGLQAKTVVIDGILSNIYYGVHPVDGVGGSEFDYIAAEVVGPTYTSMIQFYNSGTNPDAPEITQYLNAFHAE